VPPAAVFRVVSKPSGPPVETPSAAAYDYVIALGYGDVVTCEGFTIHETRVLLWGDPEVIARPFEGFA
jgi:hypothetical protein